MEVLDEKTIANIICFGFTGGGANSVPTHRGRRRQSVWCSYRQFLFMKITVPFGLYPGVELAR